MVEIWYHQLQIADVDLKIISDVLENNIIAIIYIYFPVCDNIYSRTAILNILTVNYNNNSIFTRRRYNGHPNMRSVKPDKNKLHKQPHNRIKT